MRISIGQFKIEQRIKNANSIYEAIYRLGGDATLSQIRRYLAKQLEQYNMKVTKELEDKFESGEITGTEKEREIRKRLLRPITTKTIQRCTRDDPRIDWDGTKYYISQKTRLELKGLDPEWSGLEIFREVMHRYLPEYHSEKISDFIQRLGSFVFFTFIEACRPLNDGSLTLADREYLVTYWAQHALPVDDMFTLFRANFGDKRKQLWKDSVLEMNESSISELLSGMKIAFPSIYSDLVRGRQESISKKEVTRT